MKTEGNTVVLPWHLHRALTFV